MSDATDTDDLPPVEPAVIRNVNLRQLAGRYLDGTDTAQARGLVARFYRGKSLKVEREGRQVKVKLNALLRHHADHRGVVEDWETWPRDSFDQLLTAYGLMEVAAIAGLLPSPLPHDVSAPALLVLAQPHVRAYYEDHYPLFLPRLFRLRLEGRNTTAETWDQTTTALFMRFLDLHDSIENDAAAETFLWFLDDGTRDGVGLKDVLKTLTKPEEFVRALTESPADDPLSLGLRGMQAFLWFARGLEQLLDRSADYKALQSAMWFVYEYWFSHTGSRIRGKLADAITKLVSPNPPPPTEGQALPATSADERWELPKEWPAEWGTPGGTSFAAPAGTPLPDAFAASLRRLTGDEFRTHLEEVAKQWSKA